MEVVDDKCPQQGSACGVVNRECSTSFGHKESRRAVRESYGVYLFFLIGGLQRKKSGFAGIHSSGEGLVNFSSD